MGNCQIAAITEEDRGIVPSIRVLEIYGSGKKSKVFKAGNAEGIQLVESLCEGRICLYSIADLDKDKNYEIVDPEACFIVTSSVEPLNTHPLDAPCAVEVISKSTWDSIKKLAGTITSKGNYFMLFRDRVGERSLYAFEFRSGCLNPFRLYRRGKEEFIMLFDLSGLQALAVYDRWLISKVSLKSGDSFHQQQLSFVRLDTLQERLVNVRLDPGVELIPSAWDAVLDHHLIIRTAIDNKEKRNVAIFKDELARKHSLAEASQILATDQNAVLTAFPDPEEFRLMPVSGAEPEMKGSAGAVPKVNSPRAGTSTRFIGMALPHSPSFRTSGSVLSMQAFTENFRIFRFIYDDEQGNKCVAILRKGIVDEYCKTSESLKFVFYKDGCLFGMVVRSQALEPFVLTPYNVEV